MAEGECDDGGGDDDNENYSTGRIQQVQTQRRRFEVRVWRCRCCLLMRARVLCCR
jgi:hypothetical protein